MPTPRTWTEHTFVCVDCKRLSYASRESLDECRANLADDEQDTTDAEIANCWEFCLSCAEGEELEGEHVLPESVAQVVATAEEAFWNVVVKGLNAPHWGGDFPPDAAAELTSAMTRAVERWIEYNKPSPDDEHGVREPFTSEAPRDGRLRCCVCGFDLGDASDQSRDPDCIACLNRQEQEEEENADRCRGCGADLGPNTVRTYCIDCLRKED
jgi:hypothetical protein